MTSPVQVHIYATRTPTGAQWLTEISIIPPGTDPRRWVGIDEVEHAPGAAELLYRALLTPMPLQRAELAAIAAQAHVTIAAQAHVTIGELGGVTPHGDTAEHPTYRGHHLPETP